MKKSRFTESQILAILKQHEASVPVLLTEDEVSRNMQYLTDSKNADIAWLRVNDLPDRATQGRALMSTTR